MARRATITERARVAKRESKRLDFKERFDPREKSEWPELIKDIVAMANSGGGIIIFGVRNNGEMSKADVEPVLRLDPAVVADKVHAYTGEHFADFQIHEGKRRRRRIAILEVGAVTDAPVAFTQVGTYTPREEGKQKQKTAFSRGTVYFRHGAKSEPGTAADLRAFIERRLEVVRRQWLGRIRQVVEAPAGAQVAMVEATGSGGVPTEIRLTDDPRAQLYGKLDPDRTHPYRQTELIDEVNKRLPGKATVNSHDILSVRRVHNITEATRPEWTYKPRFGSPQYSVAFAEWLVRQYRRDRKFVTKAKAAYGARR